MPKREEYLENLKNLEHEEWYPFECISIRVRILEEFYTVINNHPDELSPAFQAIIKNWGMKPSQPLIDYLLLDIKNFYWLAHKKFGDTINYPESWKIVKNFRDKIINYFGIENPLELVGLHEEVNSFGIDKIYSEYEEFKEYLRAKILNAD